MRHNDTSLSSAIGMAHFHTPGQGLPQRPLNMKWCLRCQCQRPTKGGTVDGSFFACALHPKKGAT